MITKIEEISTLDLLDELMRRCSPAVFIGIKNEGGDGINSFYNYAGRETSCIGLCYELIEEIRSNFKKRSDHE